MEITGVRAATRQQQLLMSEQQLAATAYASYVFTQQCHQVVFTVTLKFQY